MPHTCWTNTFKDFNLENLEYNIETEILIHWFLLLDNTYNLFSQILNKWVLTRVGTGCLGQLPPHPLIFPGVTGKLAEVCSLIFVQQGRFPRRIFETDSVWGDSLIFWGCSLIFVEHRYHSERFPLLKFETEVTYLIFVEQGYPSDHKSLLCVTNNIYVSMFHIIAER